VGGVEGDVFYGLGRGGGFIARGAGAVAADGGGFFGFLWESGAGDLQAVEEQAGAARVDVVGGDALEDLADGLEDGGPVFGQGDVEGGAAAAALLRVGDGFSGGVVVVAEVFVTKAGAGAAVAVGEDVAALVVPGCGLGLGCGVVGVVHVFPPPLGRMCAKSSKEKTCFRTWSECRPMRL
jgi:hypothetical protein